MSDYSEIFGGEPEPWREPLGSLRLTLSGNIGAVDVARAQAEMEELVRVLNEQPPAADNLVTVEKIAEVLHREATDDGEVHVLWGGAAEHEAEVAEWMPYARAVHALLTGEEA